MKKIFLLISFIFIILLTNNVYAFTSSDYKIILYDNISEVVSCPNSMCNTGLMRGIRRVSIISYTNSLVNNSPFTLYSSISIESDYSGNSLPFRSDKWIGNSIFSNWVQLSTSWNSIDGITQGNLPYTRFFDWGYVGNFTASFTGTGFVFDFYFSDPGIDIWSVEITRFDLVNNGTSNEDIVNNQTNIIINNNNQNTQNIIDSQSDINDSINDLNDSITDDTVSSSTGSSFFNGFQNNNHGLSSIITIPLTTIQSLTSSSCVQLQVPVPFTNSNITLPCMTTVYSQYIGTIFTIWQMVSFGIISYFICIDIFHLVKGFKDPDTDKVEVLDL